MAPSLQRRARKRGIQVVGIEDRLSPERWTELTLRALELLATEEVKPVIGNTVPLERAGDAHTAMADRSVIGKTVLTVSG